MTPVRGAEERPATRSQVVVVAQWLSLVQLFVTPWIAVCQVSLSFTISQSLTKLTSVELVIPSNHLTLCRPLLLRLRSFPEPGSLLTSWFFESGGQSTGTSASVIPVNMDCSQVLPLKPSADMRLRTSC